MSLHPFARDAAKQKGIIFRMSLARHGHNLRCRVGHEQFLARDAHALASMLCVHLRNMSLQPIGVLTELFVLRFDFGNFSRVGYFDDHSGTVLIWIMSSPSVSRHYSRC